MPLSRYEAILAEAEAAAEKEPSRAKQLLAPAPPRPAAPRHEGQGEHGPVVGTALHFMLNANATETAYGRELQRQKLAGAILEWWWQPCSFRLSFDEKGRGIFYRPDFFVLTRENILEVHETKGFMREDARHKLAWAASLYPFRFILVKRTRGTWATTPYACSFP